MASTGVFEKVQNIVSCGTNTIKASAIFYRKAILATRGLWFECKVVVPMQFLPSSSVPIFFMAALFSRTLKHDDLVLIRNILLSVVWNFIFLVDLT